MFTLILNIKIISLFHSVKVFITKYKFGDTIDSFMNVNVNC